MKDRRIESEERDSDGFWIYLRRGYCVQGGEHAIVEDTKPAARARLADVCECECKDCKA